VAEKRHLQVFLLKAHMANEVARQVEEKLVAWLDLQSRQGFDLSDEEEDAEVERPSKKGKRGSGGEPLRSETDEDGGEPE
jgi:hypothetical protein